ncbi:hypothetical protein [Actinomadura rugatobispora]|uniref:DUF4262 domain-containing protein n=1 Tax=Actinomadura rugatobispora TaxID=1994 RepID=A0ABW1A9W7_9ACTN|nr:hypothetical protein GCM10010200_012780 [Actinomadura rugatobispora]
MKRRASSERQEGGVDEMRRLFDEAGLGAPPVPAQMESLVEKRGEWVYATRDIDPMGMYMFQDYVLEALSGRVEDYMAVSHAGHGANSYAISYHLVMGPLAVFAQTGWGGVYMDKEESTAAVKTMLSRCGEVLDALQELNEAQPSRRYDGRLVVGHSTFRGASFCRWAPAAPSGDGSPWEWTDETPPSAADPYPALTKATTLLRTSPLPPPVP